MHRGLEDWRRLARRRLPRIIFDYVDGGAGTDRAIVRNRAAFDRLLFSPRPLVDVSSRSLDVSLFGRHYSLPVAIAPTGLNGAIRPGGDLMLARAASRAGIPFVLSTASTDSIEEVARNVDGDIWFQLYVLNRSIAELLVARALGAGYHTLVLTVDVPVSGRRLRELRNGFCLPFRLTTRNAVDAVRHPAWIFRQLVHGLPQLANISAGDKSTAAVQAAMLGRHMDASFSWDDVRRLRDRWPHRLLIKGIIRAEDAARCRDIGADGVIVSNHGGRQLEDVAAPLTALPKVIAHGPKVTLLDGGVRDGADVVKAVAAGAQMVLIGRAMLYGLAGGGESGVSRVIESIKQDIDMTLALIGCAAIADVNSGYLEPLDCRDGHNDRTVHTHTKRLWHGEEKMRSEHERNA